MQVKLIKSLILEALNNPSRKLPSTTSGDVAKIGAFTAVAGGAIAAAKKYGDNHSTDHEDNFLTHSNFAEGFKDAIH